MALPDEALRLDNQLCFALYSASRKLTQAYRPLLSKLGLTYPQYLVMLALWEHDRQAHPATVGDLGNQLYLDSGTLTPLLKRLEARGFISRERSSADERVVCARLTPAGRRLRHKALQIPSALVQRLHWAPGELATLRDDVNRLLHSITDSTI